MGVSDLIYNTVLIMFKGNRDFFKLIDEFHEKLPPQHKQATKSGVVIFEGMTHIDTTNMELHLTRQEIDLFHKRLENFKYNRVLFKRKAIISYSNNLQRLLRSNTWDKFNIAIIQSILEEKNPIREDHYLFGYKIRQYIGF